MSERFDHEATTTCGYCGVGCRLEAHARGGRVVSITPAMDGPANKGHTCLKGRFAHQFSRSRERLTTPLIREPDGGLRAAGWDEAIARIVSELNRIKGEHGPGRDRRPRLLARDERGLLRDGQDDSRRDRHQQHRQLLARLPLADLVGAAQVVRPVGRDRLVRRHRGRRRRDHHRREPDRGPSRRRRADQAGGAQGPEARHDRSAPDRARRLRRPAPCPAARHERRRDARSRSRRRPRRAPRPGVHRQPDRGVRRGRGAARALRARGRRADHRDPCRGSRAGRAHLRRGPERVRDLGAGRHRAPLRLGGRPADLQPHDDDREGRPSGLRAAAAARPEQRAGLLRHGRAA